MTHSQTLGTRIREARKSAGLKSTELAVALDVTQATIANYELDRTTPTLGTLSDIARITGRDVRWLTFGDREEAVA